jgi:hypothetical protein
MAMLLKGYPTTLEGVVVFIHGQELWLELPVL